MVFGTFDGLHEGHRNLFAQAKTHGDTLIVIVARDTTVQKVKGKKPIFNENNRLAAVKHQQGVDGAYLGNTDDVYRVIIVHAPEVICLGYDQKTFTDSLANWLSAQYRPIPIIRLQPYKPDIYKSSLLTKKEQQE